ncbi:60S ribosomal protein L24-like [Hylaeus volcanicus]|uniref:60S ribosomal protein L24-like n=1 Tax=Hylaeus volcanicus TaxID=313075 RepID=UPI0023B8619B|nr:60S ribosomal protein L24-like [Hylaeus volcanicus]
MSTVKSTLKLETGSFSEYKIYPGRGIRHISRDGKSYFFINSKCKSLYHQRVKPARLTWTQSWRRANKKLSSSQTTTRRRTRRTHKIQKAIVGLSLDDLAKKRSTAKKMTSTVKPVVSKEDKARTIKAEKSNVKKTGFSATKGHMDKLSFAKNAPRLGKQVASSRR